MPSKCLKCSSLYHSFTQWAASQSSKLLKDNHFNLVSCRSLKTSTTILKKEANSICQWRWACPILWSKTCKSTPKVWPIRSTLSSNLKPWLRTTWSKTCERPTSSTSAAFRSTKLQSAFWIWMRLSLSFRSLRLQALDTRWSTRILFAIFANITAKTSIKWRWWGSKNWMPRTSLRPLKSTSSSHSKICSRPCSCPFRTWSST